jgi:predicted ATPase/DNA-binding CsgD family transcriptional regulator
MTAPYVSGPRARVTVPLTGFIGREAETRRAVALLSGSRLLTITGPGGIGKTRLALAVAERVLAQFPDGIFQVELARLRDPDQVAPVLVAELGFQLSSDHAPLDVLISRMAGQRAMLLLDNFEHLLDAAWLVGDLLVACPDLTILVTSRVALNVEGEQQYPVPPLDLPAAGNSCSLQDAARAGAVDLFVQRARQHSPDFELTSGNAATVVDICRRLDGLPLAIELAATRLRLFTPQMLLDRLEHTLPLLTGGARNLPHRQQTMRATIAWSHDLLSPDEQHMFHQLSIFAGGWTLESAEAVCGAGSDVMDGIATLLDHNLVRQVELADGSSRFMMLETIREFAFEQLDVSGETGEVFRRQALYLLGLFRSAEAEWHRPDGIRWLATGDAEIDNLRSALRWAVEHDAGLALSLNLSAATYWHARGLYREARRWYEMVFESGTPLPQELYAEALANLASYATTEGDYASGYQYLEESRSIFQDLNHPGGIARCLSGLGRIAMWSGEYEQARELLEKCAAVEAADHDTNPHGLAYLGNLATVLIRLGEYEPAAVTIDELLAKVVREGDALSQATMLIQSSYLSMKQDDLESAWARVAESLMLQREILDLRFAAMALEVCSWLLVCQGEAQPAARTLGAAHAIRELVGAPVPPMIQQDYEHYVPIARRHIDPDTWDREWSQGLTMSFDEAAGFVLDVNTSRMRGTLPEPVAGLTRRETEVLHLLAEGRSNQEIALALYISQNTVASHVAHILGKLGVQSRTEAAVQAVRSGLV